MRSRRSAGCPRQQSLAGSASAFAPLQDGYEAGARCQSWCVLSRPSLTTCHESWRMHQVIHGLYSSRRAGSAATPVRFADRHSNGGAHLGHLQLPRPEDSGSGQWNHDAVRWDHADSGGKCKRRAGCWRMIMLEECRLRLCGNSVSVRLGGWRAAPRRQRDCARLDERIGRAG